MTERFDVFLSHNSQDKPVVRVLAAALIGRGLKVWLDEQQLVPGQPWQEGLEEAIQIANAAAVLVGNSGFGPWEIPEMRACLVEFVHRKIPVIPVLLPSLHNEPSLPLFLKGLTWVDLRGGLNDAGLDLLVWGVTRVKPESLERKAGLPGGVTTGQYPHPALVSNQLTDKPQTGNVVQKIDARNSQRQIIVGIQHGNINK